MICPECMQQASSEAAACPHCGYPIKGINPISKTPANVQQQEMSHFLAADIPHPVAGFRNCPKCAAQVNNAAKVCAACKFSIQDFDENINFSLYSKMEKVPFTDAEVDVALQEVYKGKNGGCFGVCLLIVGTLALLIPILGWIAGPICWILGFIVLLSPVRGFRYLDSIMKNEDYQKNVHAAKVLLHNRFKNVTCPKCGHRESYIHWYQEGGFWDCPGCQKRLLREKDYIFFLPKPDGVPNNNMIECFVKADAK